MHAKYVFDFLNEKFIGHIRDYGVEVYMNPKSLSDMQPDLRAIVDDNGNLYVADDNKFIIHGRLSQWLKSQGYDFPNTEDGIYDLYNHFVLLQRKDDTIDFYLSESYVGDEETLYAAEIRRMLKKTKEKNPQYNFIQKKIHDTGNVIDFRSNRT